VQLDETGRDLREGLSTGRAGGCSGAATDVWRFAVSPQGQRDLLWSAAIERATARTVIGFASTTSMDEPSFVAEIFKLG
jgi:hypothetical protein